MDGTVEGEILKVELGDSIVEARDEIPRAWISGGVP